MIVPAAVFTCSICGEPSTHICAYCTKDACANHRCVRCKRCSDCCECEVPLSAEEPEPEVVVVEAPNVIVEPELPTEPAVIADPVELLETEDSPDPVELREAEDSPDPVELREAEDSPDPTEPRA